MTTLELIQRLEKLAQQVGDVEVAMDTEGDYFDVEDVRFVDGMVILE